MIITTVFALLAFGSYQNTRDLHRRPPLPKVFNGTSTFAPTTILISLDGFRADFLYRNLTPTLNAFVAEGVSPRYMLPSFPSVTFPNHYTLVTGLHPESHGVVGNSFWDADWVRSSSTPTRREVCSPSGGVEESHSGPRLKGRMSKLRFICGQEVKLTSS